MPGSKERVAEFLGESGLRTEVREFDASTKNSALAADAIGCKVEEIAKSVVLVGDGAFVVVLSGDRRVDIGKVGNMVGGQVRVATPNEVRVSTGYPVGGVPPFPHKTEVRVMVDASLMRFASVWAAAGAPNAVFRISPWELVRLVGRAPADLSV